MYDNWCGFCTHASICCHTFRMRLFVVIHFRFLYINTMCTIMIVIHLLLCH